ncbi:hypothetical protein D3C85_1628370 [compost metagenome]
MDRGEVLVANERLLGRPSIGYGQARDYDPVSPRQPVVSPRGVVLGVGGDAVKGLRRVVSPASDIQRVPPLRPARW